MKKIDGGKSFYIVLESIRILSVLYQFHHSYVTNVINTNVADERMKRQQRLLWTVL